MESLAALLAGCVADPAQVRMTELDRRALSHDASHFLLLPSAIVAPRDADEVARLLRATAGAGIGLTFRSGGTSLSGQAGTEGVLADVRRHFGAIEILDDGARVRVQPGVTVKQLNARLARYGRKFGPDPASEAACTIGGVVANNSSGMACGTVENSYQTLESLVAVLPSGTVIDTGAGDADEKLRTLEPELYAGLLGLRDRVRSNPASVAKITQQFSMKNTMGYGINALLDHDRPAEILAHLIIGSEGTLAFVASATFRTIPLRSFVNTALVVFDDLYAANQALPALVATGAATLELMDATSLRVGQAFPDTPAMIKALKVDKQAALLVEYQATSEAELRQVAEAALPTLAQLPVGGPVELADDPVLRAGLWTLRKGLYTSVAGARKSGTTALLEDVVVPVANLAETCVDLAVLFDRYAYADSVIFGHAKDGNIHFMITDRFENDDQMRRYIDFTEEMVELVIANDGSLKAEHGTGRVMAPFVRRQYGDELYDVMRQIKSLFDPRGLLNAGTIITDDPDIHLKHIKLNPSVEAEVDRCTSCGYCEPVCPSRDLTLTPRQRIAVRREIENLELAGDTEAVARLDKDFDYQVVHTCAVDGMCGTACPVNINTGLLVKKLRRTTIPKPTAAVWTTLAKHWKGNHRDLLDRDGHHRRPARAVGGGPDRGEQGGASRPGHGLDPAVVGGAARRRPVAEATASGGKDLRGLCARLRQRDVRAAWKAPACRSASRSSAPRPASTCSSRPRSRRLCCGTPWSSKGIPNGYGAMRDHVLPVLKAATENGRLPVICDASSCTEGFRHMLETDPTLQIEVIDCVSFVARYVLPVLGEYTKLESLTIHPTCSSTQMGLNPDLVTVSRAVAEKVNIPMDWGCCAFAGDRGMLHPELTASATRREAAEAAQLDAEAHASCNRTCELGLTRATGKPYRHVVELLAEQAL